jgi:GAF domain-containing protein
MQEMIRHSRALYEVAAAINSSLDPAGVLTAIVQNTATAMAAKGSSILLLSTDRQDLHHSANSGLSERYLMKGPLRMDPDLAGPLEGKPVAILDVSKDPRVQYRKEAIEEGIASMLSVPIRLRGEVVGVMRVYTAEIRQFTSDDIDFVEAVANLGAIALDNAARYTEAKTDLESLRSYVYRYGGS